MLLLRSGVEYLDAVRGQRRVGRQEWHRVGQRLAHEQPVYRVLLGQAIVGDLPIVTEDPRLAMSGVTAIDATA